MSLESLVNDAKVVAVVCNQFGDTGKGKVVHALAEWADVIARGNGGNNAGHTIVIDGREYIFHLLPTGIVYDKERKKSIIGNGTVIDIEVLSQELRTWEQSGGSYNHLNVSLDAHVIMPYHIIYDKSKDQSQQRGGIGSTGRGIGPCYTDKSARRGIKIRDLLDRDRLTRKIEKNLQFYQGQPGMGTVPEMQDLSMEKILASLEPHLPLMRSLAADTIHEMQAFLSQGKKILLEGANGLLLSVEYGTYPYVTSCDTSVTGLVAGVGLPARAVDITFGLVKFPFMTRVGGGPFPTELGGKMSEEYCAAGIEHDIFYELIQYVGLDPNLLPDVREAQRTNNARALAQYEHEVSDYMASPSRRQRILNLCNSNDPFLQGVGIRLAAGEYGATTKRPRRTGWTDALAAQYAVGINGPLMILTKADVVAGIERFQIGFEYKQRRDGSISEFNRHAAELYDVEPVFSSYSGYDDIRGAKQYQELPPTLREAIKDFENFTEGKVVALSTGPRKEEIILR